MRDSRCRSPRQRATWRRCSIASSLRQHLDNKVITTRIAEEAGVASVPNVLARVDSYETLREVSKGLGPDLVIQTPFGDSGHTTFFISDEDDWREYAGEIAKEPEVKVMIGSVSVHPVVARTTLDNVVAFDGIVQGAPRPGEAPFATLWSVRRMGRSGGGPRQ